MVVDLPESVSELDSFVMNYNPSRRMCSMSQLSVVVKALWGAEWCVYFRSYRARGKPPDVVVVVIGVTSGRVRIPMFATEANGIYGYSDVDNDTRSEWCQEAMGPIVEEGRKHFKMAYARQFSEALRKTLDSEGPEGIRRVIGRLESAPEPADVDRGGRPGGLAGRRRRGPEW